MTANVTVSADTVVVAAVTLAAAVGAFLYQQARQQTRLSERVNWLCNRYAADHDTTVPWDDPIADGGPEVRADGGIDPDAPTESASRYDGFLSYAAEWHATALGLAAGFMVGALGSRELLAATVPYAAGRATARGDAHLRDIGEEPAYFAGAAFVGALVGAAVGFVLGSGPAAALR